MKINSPVCYALNFRKGDSIKTYIGCTINFKVRLQRHLRELKDNRHHNKNLQNAYNDGWEYDNNPILILCENEEHAYLTEQTLIKEAAGDENVVNILVGGDMYTRHPDRAEILARRAVTQREQASKLTKEERSARWGKPGSKNGMYGRGHTAETRELMRDIANKYYSENVSKNKGRKLSKEHVKKMSEFAKTRTGSKNSFYGKKHTPETLEYLRTVLKGKLPPNIKKVRVDGVVYESIAEAGRSLGIHLTVVRHRVISKNPKFINWEWV